MLKDNLRQIYIQKRLNISDTIFQERSNELTNKLVSRVLELAIKEVFIFLPIEKNREFDCRPMAQQLWRKGVKTYVPVSDFKTKTMCFAHYEGSTLLEEKRYGIIEPCSPELVHIENAIVVTPLLIADKNLNRIGYGGGFYDRFFSENKKVYKLGVSFFAPLEGCVETNSFDVPLDELVY